MPKGQSPKSRMQDRLESKRAREARLAGRQFYNSEQDVIGADAGFLEKAVHASRSKMGDIRRQRAEERNAPELKKLRSEISKIDKNRDIADTYGSTHKAKRFAEGGPVKAQVSGKGFKGTF